MEAESILRDIFGTNSIVVNNGASARGGSGRSLRNFDDAKVAHYLDWTNKFIEAAIAKNVPAQNQVDVRVGRIGPSQVRFCTEDHRQLIISSDRLSLYSVRQFCTIRANTRVDKGKWMYELQLGSKGLMRVGWSTVECEFHTRCGVGDTTNSYAYDGSNVKKWNRAAQKYGEQWLAGDIIGCAIDTDGGTIDYYRNGRHLGRAFENIAIGPRYFPSVSLAPTECLAANFGNTPIRYPLEEYQLLEAAPTEEIAQATLLFRWFEKIVELLNETKGTKKRRGSFFDKSANAQTFLMSIARAVLKHIGSLATIPYITHQFFVPFIQQLSEMGETSKSNSTVTEVDNTKLITCFDLLWTVLEAEQLKACLENTILCMLSIYQHLSPSLEYHDQRKMLILLRKILQHSATRRYVLKSLLFDEGRFAHFMYTKPLDQRDLVNVVPDVWWETNPIDPSVEINKEKYLQSCKTIEIAVSEVEALQTALVRTLVSRTDSEDKQATSRAMFVKGFKRFIYEYFVISEITPKIMIPLPITLCCFQRLLVVLRELWSIEVGSVPVHVPCRAFYDGSINYIGIDRVGGVLSHLQRTFKKELIDRLGPNHKLIRDLEKTRQPDRPGASNALAEFSTTQPQSSRILSIGAFKQSNFAIFERLKTFSHSAKKNTQKREDSLESAAILIELLDSVVLLYHVAAKKQLAKVTSLEDSVLEYIADVAEATEWHRRVLGEAESELVQEELVKTINFFKSILMKLSRYTAWAKAAILSMEKQAQLTWLMKTITLTLQDASVQGNMFRFVPEFYLEVLVDLCISLRNSIHPTDGIEKIPDYRKLFLDVAQFVADHFLDPRIVHEDAKDIMILLIAGLVSNSFTLEIMEEVPHEAREKLIKNMLKLYERLAWPQANWIVNKFWHGNGFAYRYKRSPHLSKKFGLRVLRERSAFENLKTTPSTVYQAHIRDALLSSPQTTVKFLDLFLNKLNWTFSEFIGWMQEIYTVSLRSAIFIDSGQMKTCATCFDLTVLLLRVLEMICTIAPEIFNVSAHSANKDLLIRLCQLLCHILNRIGSQTNCFQHVLLLEISELLSVDHFPILTAVIGILLAILKEDMNTFSANPTEVPPATRILLIEPSFQISSLYFALGNEKKEDANAKTSVTYSLTDYPESVSEEEIEKLTHMIKYIEECIVILPDTKTLNDNDDMCPICYAFPIEVTFEPCTHQTCRACIDRQLLNKRECFFCKGVIRKVVDLSGNVIHNFLSEPLNGTLAS